MRWAAASLWLKGWQETAGCQAPRRRAHRRRQLAPAASLRRRPCEGGQGAAHGGLHARLQRLVPQALHHLAAKAVDQHLAGNVGGDAARSASRAAEERVRVSAGSGSGELGGGVRWGAKPTFCCTHVTLRSGRRKRWGRGQPHREACRCAASLEVEELLLLQV